MESIIFLAGLDREVRQTNKERDKGRETKKESMLRRKKQLKSISFMTIYIHNIFYGSKT